MFKKILRSWVFWIAVLIALLGAASFWFPYLGISIAALTVISAILQGYENQHTQEDINTKHTQAISQIQMTQEDMSTKHVNAMHEIAHARGEAVIQHEEAMHEIKQAKKDAAEQYVKAIQEIKKARDEARAENILLSANKFATSLTEKDALVNDAVMLCPDFKQREYRQLGIEMSLAVISNIDYIKWQSIKSVGYFSELSFPRLPLEEEERTFFIDHAIQYLTETVLNPTNPDAQGLLYLACVYGYRHQYNEMMEVLDKVSQISQIVQVMRAEFRERQMMLILLSACDSKQIKIERLRSVLDLPLTTQASFCKYANEFLMKPHQLSSQYIEWFAVRKPEVTGETGTFIIKITPPYSSNKEQVDAFLTTPDGRYYPPIIPVDNLVSIVELYRLLTSSFILFCPIE